MKSDITASKLLELGQGQKSLLSRVERLERIATDGEADTVDGFHASQTPTSNTILALESSAKMPSHTVSGDFTIQGDFRFQVIQYLWGHYLEPRWRWSLEDNVWYHLITFTCDAGLSGSQYSGMCNGILSLGWRGRDTVGYAIFAAELWHVTVYSQGLTTAMDCDLYKLNGHTHSLPAGGATPTLSLQKEAGPTNGSLTLLVKVTSSNFDATNNMLQVSWRSESAGTNSAFVITPAWSSRLVRSPYETEEISVTDTPTVSIV